MDCSPPGFSVHGISQARILEGVAISFSKYKAYLLLFDGQYLKVSLKKKSLATYFLDLKHIPAINKLGGN